MGTYITVASVRRTCGIGSTEITDVDVEATITEVEAQVAKYFNTAFTPTEKIEKLDGDGTNRLLLGQNPLLSVLSLKIDGTAEDVDNLEIYKESGFIYLGNDSDTSKFPEKRNIVMVKYIYGMMDNTTTSTELAAASVAGSSIVLSVDSETGFTTDDWVEINGMDGNSEVAQVTATGTETITVDKLVLTHEIDSTVMLLQTNPNFTKLMNIIASIALVARIVGQSYTDIVGYTLTEFQVQKGEPYTQWRETATQLIKERDAMMSRISIRPRVVIG